MTVIIVVFSIALFVFGIMSSSILSSPPSASAEKLQNDNNGNNISHRHQLIKVESGLSISDSLTSATRTYNELLEDWSNPFADPIWTLFGDAIARKAPIDVSQSTEDGLVLGIKSPVRGNWVGYFAMSRDDNATLYHTVLTVPNKILPIWSFSTGMYIQTTTTAGKINYVACVGDASPLGVVWSIESGIGNSTDVTYHQSLWNSTEHSIAKTTTRDCTIITNGSNYLKAYIDGNMVYSSDKLDLQMPKPFNSYLEVQTTIDDMLYGKFRDYYSTTDENVKVINAPIGGIAKIVEATSPNKILAQAGVDAQGVANLNIGQYHFPLNAQIQVYNPDKIMVASTNPTPPNASIYGGDIYSAADINPP